MKRDFGRRPLRLDRIFATGPLYFVTFCTHERQRFLAKDEVHTAFVLFAKRGDEFNVAVGRYVIMPDHVLRSNESYSQKWTYVRENPARAGLVKSAKDCAYQGEIVYIDRA